MLVLMWEDDVVLLPRDESLQFCTNLFRLFHANVHVFSFFSFLRLHKYKRDIQRQIEQFC